MERRDEEGVDVAAPQKGGTSPVAMAAATPNRPAQQDGGTVEDGSFYPPVMEDLDDYYQGPACGSTYPSPAEDATHRNGDVPGNERHALDVKALVAAIVKYLESEV
ncbi:DEAD/DEAH box helicase [Babesia caballi]|uniref:DEAD/DEAH box helicase n=1 Tax=Babesia caballi TaxID=5871 RepID=A0AAV4LTS4_BABCB|nr:DEAD/DEAH box helicase [Babesia caballi]